MKKRAAPTVASPPAEGPALAHRVEDYLAGWVAARPFPANLREAVQYVLLGGGKRVRPVLAMQCCLAVGGELEQALPAAGAVELVHNFSLVHDDLPAMDDDDLRRGRPTLHRHATEAMAILAGDALVVLAFELLAEEVPDARVQSRLVRELALSTNDMIAGQVYDTLPDFDAAVPPRERLEIVHRHKTLALLRAACRMGAISGGADEAALERISRYGEAIGLMFQVVDDILDVTQTTEHLGKKAHKDAQQGKLTYPGLLGLDESRREVERLRAAAHAAIDPLGPAAGPLVETCEMLATRTR